MTGPLDLAAQLTLQIICFLQSDREAPCSAVRWSFVPWGGGLKTFGEAAARLASVEKPVVIGALSYPGSVALWRPSAIDAGEQPHIEHELANQVVGLDEALSHFQVDSAGIVRFEGWGTHVDVTVPVLRR